jgi:Protein kinase domain
MADQQQHQPQQSQHIHVPDLPLEQRLQQLQMGAPVTPRPLITPIPGSRRPFDMLARPPTDPMRFERPRFERGRRDDVLCYNADDDSHTQLRNVLFRDFREGDYHVKYAYYPTPYKVPIKTIMGHVEICNVLERCKRHKDDDDDDDLSDNSSCAAGDEDDDIVFQWTDRKVAVKVNSCATMEQLRGRHAEDPLKEIACMQLIGTKHENVLGCIEALFDGQNLNVVMPYCDSGDLFQLLQDTQAMNTGRENAPPGLAEGQARYWFRQVMKGVQYLHDECGICHR